MGLTGKLVCHGAACKCQFGTSSDNLVVSSQSKHYINDPENSEKLMATNKELSQPFKSKTFGKCKLQPTSSGYRPCKPNITQWTGFYEKIKLKENSGYPLLEGSKASCAISGSPSVSITFHGQVGEPSISSFHEAEEDVISQVNPVIAPTKIDKLDPFENITITN